VTAFHHQHAAGREVVRGVAQNLAYAIKAVFARGEGQRGFVTVFGRQPPHGCAAHIGRVADDQLIAFSAKG
jgi:hypothetical protein